VPTHFNFILTEAAGVRIYGSVLVFDETLSQEMKNQVRDKGFVYNVNLDQIYTQKAICVLSHYGFLESFKEVMKQYGLGPNGGIVTSLNLFATRFDQVLSILEKRKKECEYILFDTPGQIEVFTWSASGQISRAITSSCAAMRATAS
jgi:GTPase SAR1 family protein